MPWGWEERVPIRERLAEEQTNVRAPQGEDARRRGWGYKEGRTEPMHGGCVVLHLYLKGESLESVCGSHWWEEKGTLQKKSGSNILGWTGVLRACRETPGHLAFARKPSSVGSDDPRLDGRPPGNHRAGLGRRTIHVHGWQRGCVDACIEPNGIA